MPPPVEVGGGHSEQSITFKLPPGSEGGQTLLLTIQRPPESIELSVPTGANTGDIIAGSTSLGHTLHVPCPAGALPGSRLLLTAPLPPQTVQVTLPFDARAGMSVQFPLPSPLDANNGNNDGGPLSLQTPGANSRDRNGKRRASVEDVGVSSGGPLSSGNKRGRRPNVRDDAAIATVQAEGLSALRGFHHQAVVDGGNGRSNGVVQEASGMLKRLRTMPETAATWALLEALRPRLHLPTLTLPQLEKLFCEAEPPSILGPDGGDGGGALIAVLFELLLRAIRMKADPAKVKKQTQPVDAPQVKRESWRRSERRLRAKPSRARSD